MHFSLPILLITSLTTPTTSLLAHSFPIHVRTKTYCAWLLSDETFKGCVGNIDQLHCLLQVSWRPPRLWPSWIWTRWRANWFYPLCLGLDTWHKPIRWRRRITVWGILKWRMELVVHMHSILHLSMHIKWRCWRNWIKYNEKINEVFGHAFSAKLGNVGIVYRHFCMEITAKEFQLDQGHPFMRRLFFYCL